MTRSEGPLVADADGSAFARHCEKLVAAGLMAPYILAEERRVARVLTIGCMPGKWAGGQRQFDWSATVILAHSTKRLSMSGSLPEVAAVSAFFRQLLESHSAHNPMDDLASRWSIVIDKWLDDSECPIYLRVPE